MTGRGLQSCGRIKTLAPSRRWSNTLLPQKLTLVRICLCLELYRLLDPPPKSGVKAWATAEPGGSLRTTVSGPEEPPLPLMRALMIDFLKDMVVGWVKMLKMVMCQRQFSILTVCLEIIRNSIRPSLAGRIVQSMGLGFFPLVGTVPV